MTNESANSSRPQAVDRTTFQAELASPSGLRRRELDDDGGIRAEQV